MSDFTVEFDEIYQENKKYRIVGIMTSSGYRCGYISVPVDHPYYKVYYDEIDIDVHGGLTFSKFSKVYPVITSKDTYWIGFDCSHCMDLCDLEFLKENDHKLYEIMNKIKSNEGTLKTKEYVHNECVNVIKHLIKENKS